MSSDTETPITDALVAELHQLKSNTLEYPCEVQLRDHAKDLEKQLSVTRRELEEERATLQNMVLDARTDRDTALARAEQAERVAQVCYDMHERLGIKWGDDPYVRLTELERDKESLDWLESLPERVSIGERNAVFQRLLYLRYPENLQIRKVIAAMMKGEKP